MMFLQVVGGLVIFFIVFVLLGIPLGYTEVTKSKNVDGKTTITIKSGNQQEDKQIE